MTLSIGSNERIVHVHAPKSYLEDAARSANNAFMSDREFAARLKARARELGLSDAAVARRVGISERRYGHYAKGDREPNLELLAKIARALETTPNHLLGFEPAASAEARRPGAGVNLPGLGSRIHQARTRLPRYRLGRSFAEAAGLEESRLRQIEDGLAEPTVAELVLMSDLLGVPVGALIHGEAMPAGVAEAGPTIHDPEQDWQR